MSYLLYLIEAEQEEEEEASERKWMNYHSQKSFFNLSAIYLQRLIIFLTIPNAGAINLEEWNLLCQCGVGEFPGIEESFRAQNKD